MSLSSFGGSNIACLTPANCFINVNNQFFDPNSVLKATLSNNLGGEVARNTSGTAFTFYGGWIYARLMNPSDEIPDRIPDHLPGHFRSRGLL